MKFHRYPSIGHFDEEKELEYTKSLILEGKIEDNFIVQEKIHGANFSIWYDGKNIKYAKRTAFLEDDNEDFFDYTWMSERKELEIKTLLEKVWKKEEAKEGIVIYGELIGGGYPEAEKIKGLKTVQAGVWYTNTLDFIPFDIFVDNHFLKIKNSREYFKNSGFTELDILFEGPLEEALKYNTKYISEIPKKYGMNELESNIVEGVVISSTDSHQKFKKKNNEFKESSRKHRYQKQSPELSEEGQKVATKITDYLGEDVLLNRLEGLISKNGESILQNQARAAGMLARDIVEEVERRHDDYLDLEKKDRKLINASINRGSSLIVKGYCKIKKL